MEKVLEKTHIYENDHSSPIIDTSFVLFFLAVEIGQNLSSFAFDTFIMLIAMAAVAVLPYFLDESEEIELGKWLIGRGFIVGFALTLGIIFNLSIGTVFPEVVSFLPLTFVILTAMLSCYLQFYSFFRFRLSK